MRTSNELDIHKYLDIFHKYKWHGLIPAIAVMVVLAIGSSFLPKVYESTCKVEVDRGTIENPLKTRRDRPPELREQMIVFQQKALRWNILAEVVDEVGFEAVLENADVYNLRKRRQDLLPSKENMTRPQEDYQQKENVIGLLRKGVKFSLREPRFLELSYRGTHSGVNAKILNTLVSNLIEEKTRTEIHQAGRKYDFVKNELEVYRKRLEEAEGQLREYKEKNIVDIPVDYMKVNMPGGVNENVYVNLSQLTKDRTQLFELQLELRELTARVDYIDKQLQTQEELIVSEVKREMNPMVVVLNERIVGMEIELTQLRTNYTELHPKVIELKGQLEDLKRQRDELQESTVDSETSMLNPVHQQLIKERQDALLRIESVRNRIDSLQQRIKEGEGEARNIPTQQQQLQKLTRNYEITAGVYNMLLKKLEEVSIEEKLAAEEEDQESFTVLEYARPTLTPVAPNLLRILAVILLVSGGTCFGIMAILNFFDDSFKSIEEAKEFLNKPLLGTVPTLSGNHFNGSVTIRERFLKLLKK